MSTTLKTRMTLVVSLLVTVLLSVMSVVSLSYFEREYKEIIYRYQFSVVTTMADSIDSKVRDSTNALTLLASNLPLRIISDPAAVRRFIADHPYSSQLFDNGLFLLSSRGEMLGGSIVGPHMRGEEYSSRDYFKKTIATGKPYISEPFLSTQEGRHPIVVFTAPVFDGKGGLAAVLCGSLDLIKDNYLGRLAGIRMGEKGYLYLYNTSRTLIVHKERGRMLKRDVPPGANRLFDLAIKGFEGTGETITSRGLATLSSFKRLKTTGWILASNYPRTEAYAPIYRAKKYLLAALLVVLLFSILVVRYSMQRLTAPLVTFTGRVRQMTGAEGEPEPIAVAGSVSAEIATLGQTFNMMLAEMEQRKKFERGQLEFLHILLDTIPNPVFFKDREGRYLGCNRAFEEMLGIPRTELVGKTVCDLLPGDLAEIHAEADEMLFLQQGSRVYESRLKLADGTLHDLLFYKAAFTNPDGAPGGVIGTIVDISERRRAEFELAEHAEFAVNLIQNSTIPTFVIDSGHCVIIWNRACEVLTGVKAYEVVGSHDIGKVFYGHKRPVLADFIADGNLEALQENYSGHTRSTLIPAGIQVESWFVELNGKERFLSFTAAPIENSAGELIAVIQTLEEITERKRADEDMQWTLSLLGATLESTADGIMVVDREEKIVRFNQKFVDMWRISGAVPEELEERRTLSYVASQLSHPEAFLDKVRELYSDPGAESYDLIEFKDGRIFEWYSKPQRIGETIMGRVWSFRDITAQRRLEAQLRHSQKMEALGTLAGGVAHDFNNMLTAIIGFSSLIQMGMDKGDPKMIYLNQVLAAAERATVLTQSLLAYSRKEPLNPGRYDLNEIVRKVVKFLSRLIGEDIELQIALHDMELTIMADSGQIEQVLMNLATNARDAMPGKGKLAISTRMVELGEEFVRVSGHGNAGNYVNLTVSDTGSGMEKATMERIFEPFFTTKQMGRGTGLGLSIVYGIVKQHNGIINVTSEQGKGTSFELYFPLVASMGKIEETVDLKTIEGGSETILIVEDSPEIRDLLNQVLTGAGYKVIEAVDGQDGVEKFMAHRDDVRLLLLDVIMPRKNGREAYEEICGMNAEIKAIFTSGYTAEIISREGIIEGKYNFLAKPLSPEMILSRVRQALDG
jgi:PAS domain S-box-containing protein